MGYALSYLVSSIGMSEEPKEKKKGAARKKSTKSAHKDVTELGKTQLEPQPVEDRKRKPSEGEPNGKLVCRGQDSSRLNSDGFDGSIKVKVQLVNSGLY